MPRYRKPERKKTDASLAYERHKTDDELRKRGAAEDATADAVLATARSRARRVIGRARRAADDELRRQGTTIKARRTLAAERAAEDAVLAREHATADRTLAHERVAERRSTRALLTHEREHTDERLRDERRRSDVEVAARDEFLAMVSHDLRNMLVAIGMSASALLATRDARVRAAIELDASRIQRCVTQMERLVRDLGDLVSIEAGRLAIEPKRHEVFPLIEEAREAFRPLAVAKGISLVADVKRTSLVARYDRRRIFQVLDNLLGNALKFTPEGGRIRIDAEQSGRAVRFGVSDTAPGVGADDVDALFEKFKRAPNRLEPVGLGLGLYIAKAIVEAHGGEIWIESTRGEGAKVYFTVPS